MNKIDKLVERICESTLVQYPNSTSEAIDNIDKIVTDVSSLAVHNFVNRSLASVNIATRPAYYRLLNHMFGYHIMFKQHKYFFPTRR